MILSEKEENELKSLKKHKSHVILEIRKKRVKMNQLVNKKQSKTKLYESTIKQLKVFLARKEELSKQIGKLEIKKLKK